MRLALPVIPWVPGALQIVTVSSNTPDMLWCVVFLRLEPTFNFFSSKHVPGHDLCLAARRPLVHRRHVDARHVMLVWNHLQGFPRRDIRDVRTFAALVVQNLHGEGHHGQGQANQRGDEYSSYPEKERERERERERELSLIQI